MRTRGDHISPAASRLWRRGWLALLVLSGAVLASCLREDELHCENAVAHMERCCPDGISVLVSCVYHFGLCTTTEPTIGVRTSRCIVETSCEELRASVACGGTEPLDCWVGP